MTALMCVCALGVLGLVIVLNLRAALRWMEEV